MLALTWYATMLQLLIGIVKLNFPDSPLFLSFREIPSTITNIISMPPVEKSDIPRTSMAAIDIESSSPLALLHMDGTRYCKSVLKDKSLTHRGNSLRASTAAGHAHRQSVSRTLLRECANVLRFSRSFRSHPHTRRRVQTDAHIATSQRQSLASMLLTFAHDIFIGRGFSSLASRLHMN